MHELRLEKCLNSLSLEAMNSEMGQSKKEGKQNKQEGRKRRFLEERLIG